MMQKLKFIFKNRILISKIILAKLLIILPKKIFSYGAEARSESDNGVYIKGVYQILKRPKKFAKFKRNFRYMPVLEHVTYELGLEYFKIIKNRDYSFLQNALSYSKIADKIGKPIKHIYDNNFHALSPTTLRYVKVASDLNLLFDKNINNVIEIGCGYGGQCLTNDFLLNYKSQTLVDLPLVNQLIERYLESHVMNGSYQTKTLNQLTEKNYDLVISNYAFSELPSNLQNKFIEKVLIHSKSGYLTMNSGLGGKYDHNKLQISRLLEVIPNSVVLEEQPKTYEYNYLLVWGHSDKNLSQFKIKKI